MGLIDFVREAGESLLAKGKEAGEEVRGRVQSLGLPVDGLKIAVDDAGKAVVQGKAPSQEAKEKAILAVGNTQGIGQVEDQIEVDAPEPESQYYRVQKGDTLSKIAKQFYDSANQYPKIFEANKPMLADPDKIYPGQVLRIPPA